MLNPWLRTLVCGAAVALVSTGCGAGSSDEASEGTVRATTSTIGLPSSTVAPGDQCAEIDRHPIGGYLPDDPSVAVLEKAAPRFETVGRDVASMVGVPEDTLVCGAPMGEWREDLVIQEVWVADKKLGFLSGGPADSDPVMFFNTAAWTGFDWVAPGNAGSMNFTGHPVERTTMDGVGVVRTTTGGIVEAYPDGPWVPVVGHAWEVWVDAGGPSGSMGLPLSSPTGRGVGGFQAFEHGVLELPEVQSAYEAMEVPADRYVWHPSAELDLPRITPGAVVSFGRPSYYVDQAGRRLWIETTEDYYCAVDLGGEVLGQVTVEYMSASPLGPVFTCPT